MADTQELIANLSTGAQPVTPAGSPLTLFAKWLGVSVLYVGALALFVGLRPDLLAKLHAPLFLAEVLSLAAITCMAALSAAFLAFPDMHQKRWMLFAPLPPLLVFFAVLCMEWLADNPPAPLPPHGLDCLLCITLFTLLPAGTMLLMIRRRASVHYYIAGGIALLAASSLGCLGLRLAEDTDSISHLLTWHYLPMVGFGTLGLWLGRRFLKW